MASGSPTNTHPAHTEMLATQASLSLGESVLQEIQTALVRERNLLLQAERSVTELTKTLCDSRAVNKDVNSRWEQKVEKQIENMQERLLDKQEATKQRLDQKKKLQELAEKAQDDLEDVIGIPEEEDKLKEVLKKQSQLRCVLNKKYSENVERERQLNEQQKLYAAKQQVVREKELALEGQRALDEFRKQHEAGIRLPTQRMFYVENAPWYQRLRF
mmetsp:Transcript_23816/g.39925  ORF Transcript_23816/g.39925 Transcript_23816/m.39925 type:complete len:216 (-) Transcript_23816:384-1031(-)